MENRITLFANGIADFNMVYDVERNGGKGTEIIIPVRKDALGDAINLSVFGLTEADHIRTLSTSFPPENANQSKLTIEPGNTFSLFSKLSSALIKIKRSDGKDFEGRLLGTEIQDEDRGSHKIQNRFLTMLLNDGMSMRVPFQEVVQYGFTEDQIKREVERALQSNYDKITPDSSQIRLQLTCEGQDRAKAVTTPIAVWAMAYQIRKMGEVYRLTGNAIVHNNTDMTWNDVRVRCVTGIPYTIKTNIAKQTVPDRNTVSYGTAKAAGGTSASRSRSLQASPAALMSPQSDAGYEGVSFAAGGGQALSGGVDASVVGDFSVLTPKELQTIPSNYSSPIEVISTDIRECESVLYYNFNQDDGSGRPQMALEFKNPLPHSMQNGPCNVYEGDLFQGTANLPNMKPAETNYALHGQDTAVDVRREGGGIKTMFSRLEIQKGVVQTTTAHRASVTYRVSSLKDKPIRLTIDHDRIIASDKVEITSETPSEITTNGGRRFKIQVPAKGFIDLKLTEVSYLPSTVEFRDLKWLRDNIITTSHPALKSIKNLEPALSVASDIESLDGDIKQAELKLSSLEQHQKDIRANLQVSDKSPHAVEWQNQLAANDKAILPLRETTIPNLKTRRTELEKQLRTTLQNVFLSWQE